MTPSPAIEAVEPVRSGGRWALAFVTLSLVAVVLVPAWVGRGQARAQRELANVLEPSARAASELISVQALQMARFQAFLVSGDPALRLQYSALLPRERELYAQLDSLLRELDFSIRERLAQITVQATNWHLGHQTALEVVDPAEAAARTDQLSDRRAFDALQRSTRELQRLIRAEMDEAHARMDEGRRRLFWITLALAALALGSTIVLGFVGRQLRQLTAEAERRRAHAVGARREITALMEATSDGVLGIDPEGRCTSLNRAGTELLGYPERRLVGRDVHDAIHHTRPDGTPRPREDSRILRALESRGSASEEDDVLWRRDGTSFPARWTLRPLVDGLTIKGAVLTFIDMTETRERERALELAVRARDEMVSVVSHDLRNPLGVVAAAADLLLDLPLTEAERRKQAEIIARSAVRMGRLVDDLLDVSRLEAGALRMRPEPVRVRPLLDETVESFRAQADERRIELTVDVADGTPPAYADRERVLQALANLVSNALRFTPEGGRIDLRGGCGDGRVRLSVSDTGEGIRPGDLEHLFDRFWRPSDSRDRGAGLGLAIVKGIAEGLGGSVAVESELGEGSTFTLELPAAESD